LNFLEQFKDKKIVHISDVDFDGCICLMLGQIYLKPIAKEFYQFGTGDRQLPDFPWDKIKNTEIVIFTDIMPYNIEMVEELNKYVKVYYFDHHESHYKIFNNRKEVENYFYDSSICASKIFFNNLTQGIRIKKIIFQIVEMCNSYDALYDYNSPNWRSIKALNNLVYEYINWKIAHFQNEVEKHQPFIDTLLKKIDRANEFYFTILDKEKALNAEKKEKKQFEEAKKSLQIRKDTMGNIYGYFECSSKLSWIACLVLRAYPQLKYVIGHATFLEKYRNEINGKVSLRSLNDFDVGIIAEKWKNGGHKTAAGINLELEDFYKLREGKIHLI
jgi:oligoribonuclease NrnB/cAMP/cGMP phosphodiesterase (DHH superfamily)